MEMFYFIHGTKLAAPVKSRRHFLFLNRYSHDVKRIGISPFFFYGNEKYMLLSSYAIKGGLQRRKNKTKQVYSFFCMFISY